MNNFTVNGSPKSNWYAYPLFKIRCTFLLFFNDLGILKKQVNVFFYLGNNFLFINFSSKERKK
jgi:hypothetical protein